MFKSNVLRMESDKNFRQIVIFVNRYTTIVLDVVIFVFLIDLSKLIIGLLKKIVTI